jgi:RNA polymerase sigma-70 factor (ECF subfamily)
MVDGREAELIERVRMGLESAYRELLAPLLPQALRLAYGMLQDRSAAEDCVQEAALRAWRRIENLEPGRSFRPWFLGIVANRCRETRRSRWWRSAIQVPRTGEKLEYLEATSRDPLEGAELRGAVARLPHRLRVAIILHFYLDLPLEEVAATLGLRIAGVKTRINLGLRQLRVALETDEVMKS